MKVQTHVKLAAIGFLAVLAVLGLALQAGHGARTAQATMNPLPPLIACPNVDASPDNTVAIADILSVRNHYGKSYGQAGYGYLWDPVSPYNSSSPSGTGTITVADILYVVNRFNQRCPLLDTQIATATRAIVDANFSSKYCDPSYATAVSCGGDPQFLTENVSFLAGKGYLRGSTDVPGQGIHYVNFSYWSDVFNPARPPGLVYKGGVLVAQLYYAFGGDSGAGIAGVGWGGDPTHNVRAINIDALPCAPASGGPPNTGCSWAGNLDGWHWHSNLCTAGIGSPNAFAFPGVASQDQCAQFGSNLGITCTFPSTPPPWTTVNFNCAWGSAVGWMGHLWNWLPNPNYTNAVNPGPGGYNDCQTAYCSTGESNGRFADCSPDGSTWTAYNCPQ